MTDTATQPAFDILSPLPTPEGLIPRGPKPHERPMIIPAGGGAPEQYSRSSGYGKSLEYSKPLEERDQRNVLLGMLTDPSILLLADQLADPSTGVGLEPPDPETDPTAYRGWKKSWDALVWRLQEATGANDRSSLGTYMHSCFEAIDLGGQLPPIPEDLAKLVTPEQRARDIAARAEATQGWRWVAREKFVVNDEHKAAGTLDGLVLVEDDGQLKLRIVDDKTGKNLRYGHLTRAAQVALYTGSLLYDPFTGERAQLVQLVRHLGVDPADVQLDTDTAVIVHTPAGEGICTIVEVDLDGARAVPAEVLRLKALSSASRRWFKTVSKHVAPVLDREPESIPHSGGVVDIVLDSIAAATTAQELAAIKSKYSALVNRGTTEDPRWVANWSKDYQRALDERAETILIIEPIAAAGDRAAMLAIAKANAAIWDKERHGALARARLALLDAGVVSAA